MNPAHTPPATPPDRAPRTFSADSDHTGREPYETTGWELAKRSVAPTTGTTLLSLLLIPNNTGRKAYEKTSDIPTAHVYRPAGPHGPAPWPCLRAYRQPLKKGGDVETAERVQIIVAPSILQHVSFLHATSAVASETTGDLRGLNVGSTPLPSSHG